MNKRFAIVINDKVANVALSENPIEENWIESDVAAIGDDYDPVTGVFTTPTPPVVNHSTAGNFQIRKVIIDMGKIAQVRTAVSSGSDDVIEYWKHNDVFIISDPEIIFVKDALGLSNSALQNLFNNANQ